VGIESPDKQRKVNTRRAIKWVSIAVVAGVVLFVALLLPRTRSLPEGYSYAYFPRSGYRYLIAPGGIKKVGQEVIDYHVTGTVVTGTVRLRLEHDDVRTFRLDLKTHVVTLGDGVQRDTH
jgi:multisubunit Na+/H+ antiporter MnhB subunit